MKIRKDNPSIAAPLKTIGVGAGLALLICLICLLGYGRIYFFDGYLITRLAWMISIASVAIGIIALVAELLHLPGLLIQITGIVFAISAWPFFNYIKDMCRITNRYYYNVRSFFIDSWWRLALISSIVGIAMIVIGRDLRAAKKQRNLEQWRTAYGDPQWRKDHPKEASAVEDALERERQQQEAERKRKHQRLYGPAVSLTAQAGHMDDYGYWCNYPNYAGGWSIRCNISNIGARTIKYVKITFVPYNAVGDKCYSSTTGLADVICTYTGPLYDGHSSGGITFENLWYDIPLSKLSLENIHVDFMDGKSQDISEYGSVTNHGF